MIDVKLEVFVRCIVDISKLGKVYDKNDLYYDLDLLPTPLLVEEFNWKVDYMSYRTVDLTFYMNFGSVKDMDVLSNFSNYQDMREYFSNIIDFVFGVDDVQFSFSLDSQLSIDNSTVLLLDFTELNRNIVELRELSDSENVLYITTTEYCKTNIKLGLDYFTTIQMNNDFILYYVHKMFNENYDSDIRYRDFVDVDSLADFDLDSIFE